MTMKGCLPVLVLRGKGQSNTYCAGQSHPKKKRPTVNSNSIPTDSQRKDKG